MEKYQGFLPFVFIIIGWFLVAKGNSRFGGRDEMNPEPFKWISQSKTKGLQTPPKKRRFYFKGLHFIPQVHLKNVQFNFFLLGLLLISLCVFGYLAIYRIGAPHDNLNVFYDYYLLQWQKIRYVIAGFAGLIALLSIGWLLVKKKDTDKRLVLRVAASIGTVFLGFNLAFPGIYAFVFVENKLIQYKVTHDPSSYGLIPDETGLVAKLKGMEDAPFIVKGDDNISNQIIRNMITGRNNKSQFYSQRVLAKIQGQFSFNLGISDERPVVLFGNTLYIKSFDVPTMEEISPLLAKLMVEKETDHQYYKGYADMHLMDRQEYLVFRTDQINARIEKLEGAIASVTEVISAYYADIANDKNNINYNESQSRLAINLGDLEYTSCINAEDCTYDYIPGRCSYSYTLSYTYCSPGYSLRNCSPRYSHSYCASQRDYYYRRSDDYSRDADSWRAQLRSDQYEVGLYLAIRDILDSYRQLAEASKEDLPFELGAFFPPNSIKIALDSTKIESLADYFATVVHEYYHYTSYRSEDEQLPLFFEEGLTEYFARKTVKNTMGTDTYEGYPLIVAVLNRIMEKVPEDELKAIYFTKDSDLLARKLDDVFGKDYYKNNELYFDYISYIPTDKALEITNKLMDKMGLAHIEEANLYSQTSEFK